MNAPLPANPRPRWATALFLGEHLPARMVLIVLLLIATNAAQILMGQPAGYWLDLRINREAWMIPVLLARGPWFFSGLVMLYMMAAGLLLARLERTKALFVAGTLVLLHTFYLANGSYCRIAPFGWASKTDVCGLHFFAQWVLWAGVFAVVVTSLFPLPIRLPGKRWPAVLTAAGAVLAVGWLGLQIYGVLRSAATPSTGWRALAPHSSPSPREGMGIAYDTARQRAVLFGGEGVDPGNQSLLFSETWEWDGQNWAQIPTVTTPPARRVPAIAYDERRGVVVMYGGWNNNGVLQDLWEYDGVNWTERCPSCTPAARWGATMMYEPQLQKVVLYGGVSRGEGEAPDHWHTEAWAWDGTYWEYTGIDSAAPAAFRPSLVYDTERAVTLAFVDMEYGGAWIWVDRMWHHVMTAGQPPPASGASMIYDPAFQRIVLYGGMQNPGAQYHNQTWIYKDGDWKQQFTPLVPKPRRDQVGFYDTTRQAMIVFGGRGIDNVLLNDTWELPLASAEPGLPGGTP